VTERREVDRLAGIDAAFLYLETGTAHMHVVGTLLLEGGDPPFCFERLRDTIQARLHLVPPFRRRVAHIPLRLGHPVWADDPCFRLGAHLHRIAAPSPGSMSVLADLVGDLAAIPLDRNRPLWEIWAVEGLRGGRTALVCKFHHAAIDGVTGADLMQHLLDTEPNGRPGEAPPEEWRPPRLPSELALLRNALGDIAAQPLRAARGLAHTGSALARLAWEAWGTGASARSPAVPFASPRTMLNHAITGDRSVAFGSASLTEVKRIKNALGLTVNDVILAACSLALRAYLRAHDHLPEEPMVAAVPVSLHGQGGEAAHNAVSAMFVRLPVHLARTEQHLEFVREEAARAKRMHAASPHSLIAEWAEMLSPTWFAGLVNLYSSYHLAEMHRPLYNLVVSNVPGPQFPLYCAGSRVEACYPLGPIFEGAALNLTVMSYLDSVHFGVLGCPHTTPAVGEIVHALRGALRRIAKVAGKRGGGRRISAERATAL
jgi:diacylglycerol O-acyltransferase / wax synthase